MARISRVTHRIFASDATNNGVFGSAQAGTPTLSALISTLMAGAAWLNGWLSSVMGGASKFPPLEEFQAVEYVHSTQLAYLLQQGIPEYDAGTTYYTNQICVKAGTYQVYGSVTNGNIGNVLTDAANWKLLIDYGNYRQRLTADANYYVATTGNDSNTGSIGSPWLTIQKAINYIFQNIDAAGFAVNINVADGTYTGHIEVDYRLSGSGFLNLIGNVGSPASCIISTTSLDCIGVNGFGALLNVKGFKFQTTTAGQCLNASEGGVINVNGAVSFGVCADAHNFASQGGQINLSSSYSIVGGAKNHFNENNGGQIIVNSPAVTITGTPAFSVAFASANDLSILSVNSGVTTFTGSATGSRYSSSAGSIIQTAGSGITYLPGNAVGSTPTNGQYL